MTRLQQLQIPVNRLRFTFEKRFVWIERKRNWKGKLLKTKRKYYKWEPCIFANFFLDEIEFMLDEIRFNPLQKEFIFLIREDTYRVTLDNNEETDSEQEDVPPPSDRPNPQGPFL